MSKPVTRRLLALFADLANSPPSDEAEEPVGDVPQPAEGEPVEGMPEEPVSQAIQAMRTSRATAGTPGPTPVQAKPIKRRKIGAMDIPEGFK